MKPILIKIKKSICKFLVACMVFCMTSYIGVVSNINILTGEDNSPVEVKAVHVHTAECYVVGSAKHQHKDANGYVRDSSWYSSSASGCFQKYNPSGYDEHECSGTSWTQTYSWYHREIDNPDCPNHGMSSYCYGYPDETVPGSSGYNICEYCGEKDAEYGYSDTPSGEKCDTCGQVFYPFYYGHTVSEYRPQRYTLSCPYNTTDYYLNGSVAQPVCSQTVISMAPTITEQTITYAGSGTPYVHTATLTFKDGHTEVANCAVSGYSETNFNTWQTITLTAPYAYSSSGAAGEQASNVAKTCTAKIYVQGYKNVSVRTDEMYKGAPYLIKSDGATTGTSFQEIIGRNITLVGNPYDGFYVYEWRDQYGNLVTDTSGRALQDVWGDGRYNSAIFKLPNDDRVFKAIYKAYATTVTWNANGGKFSNGSSTVSKTISRNSVYGDPGTPTRSGYVFLGWKIDNSGDYISSINVMNRGSSHTLYAQWSAEAPRDITRHYDDAFGAIQYTLRTGYTFLGWCLKENSSYNNGLAAYRLAGTVSGNTAYINSVYLKYLYKYNGENITANNNQALFANWMPVTATINFVCQNGATINTSYIWDASGSQKQHSSTSSSKQVTFGTKVGKLPTANLAGQTFIGWSTNHESSGLINANSIVDFTGSITVYAIFSPNPATDYTVVVYSNYPAGSTELYRFTVREGNAMSGISTAQSRLSYFDMEFLGFYDSNATDGGAQYFASTVASKTAFNSSGVLYLYGRWKHSVTYYPNASDAVGNMETQYACGTTPVTISANGFSRPGYTFAGWKTAPSSGTAYSAGSTYTGYQNLTLYAQWAANPVSITLYGRGGTIDGASSKALTGLVYNGTLPSSVSPAVKSGFTFLGYYTGPNQTGEKIYNSSGQYCYSGGTIHLTDNVFVSIGNNDTKAWSKVDALYAAYSATVTYNFGSAPARENASVVYPKTVTFSYDNGTIYPAQIQVADNPFKWEGYVFTGWRLFRPTGSTWTSRYFISALDQQTGGQSIYPAAKDHGVLPQSDLLNGSVILVAQWQQKKTLVTLDGNGGKISGNKKVDLYSSSSPLTYGQSVTSSVTVPTFNDWRFTGYWYKDADGSWTKIYDETGTFVYDADGDGTIDYLVNTPNSIFMPSFSNSGFNSVTLYARWACTVEYFDNTSYGKDRNGVAFSDYSPLTVTGTRPQKLIIERESITDLSVANNPYSRAGYVFDGWSVSPSGATGYISSADKTKTGANTLASTVISANTLKNGTGRFELYAHFKRTNLTITLDNNGGTESSIGFFSHPTTSSLAGVEYNAQRVKDADSPYKFGYGDTIFEWVSIPEKTGFEFTGYYYGSVETPIYDAIGRFRYDADGNGYISDEDRLVRNYGDSFLKTAWENVTYTLKARWSGTVKYDSNTAYGKDIINVPIYEGSSFAGTAPTDQRFDYDNENQISPLAIPDNTFSLNGYIFIGWNTKADGTGKWFCSENDKSVAHAGGVSDYGVTGETELRHADLVNGSITLFAQWQRKTTSITLDYRGGKDSNNKTSFNFYAKNENNQNVTAMGYGLTFMPEKAPVITKKGFDFQGYFTTIACAGVLIYDKDGNFVYDANGDGTVNESDRQLFYENGYADSIFKPSLPNNSVTLYAGWTCTIKYNNNNAHGKDIDQVTFFTGSPVSGTTPDDKTIVEENIETETVLDNPFKRNGYVFVGWNTKPDGTGTWYCSAKDLNTARQKGFDYSIYSGNTVIPKATIQATGNMTLYAQFHRTYQSVYIDFRGGRVDNEPGYYLSNETFLTDEADYYETVARNPYGAYNGKYNWVARHLSYGTYLPEKTNVPVKINSFNGWVFHGYYTGTYGTGQMIYDEDGNFCYDTDGDGIVDRSDRQLIYGKKVGTPSGEIEITSLTRLYAYWTNIVNELPTDDDIHVHLDVSDANGNYDVTEAIPSTESIKVSGTIPKYIIQFTYTDILTGISTDYYFDITENTAVAYPDPTSEEVCVVYSHSSTDPYDIVYLPDINNWTLYHIKELDITALKDNVRLVSDYTKFYELDTMAGCPASGNLALLTDPKLKETISVESSGNSENIDLIPTAPNGTYHISYRITVGDSDTDDTNNKQAEFEDGDIINIHTPVAMDLDGSSVTSGDGAGKIILNSLTRSFSVTPTNTYTHLPLTGYGLNDYVYSATNRLLLTKFRDTVDGKEYIGNLVAFEFDVWADKTGNGMSADDYYYPAGTNIPIGLGRTFYVPSSTPIGTHTVAFASVPVNIQLGANYRVFNLVSDTLRLANGSVTERYANKTLDDPATAESEATYIAYNSVWYDVNSSINGFEAYYTDCNYDDNETTLNDYAVSSGITLPANSIMLKRGYSADFRIFTSGGFMTDSAYIEVIPKYELVDENFNVIDTNPAVFYDNSAVEQHAYAKNILADTDQKTFALCDNKLNVPADILAKTDSLYPALSYLNKNKVAESYTYSKIKLTAYARAINKLASSVAVPSGMDIDELQRSQQAWYFLFRLPSDTRVLKHDAEFLTWNDERQKAELIYGWNGFERAGYLKVTFTVVAYDDLYGTTQGGKTWDRLTYSPAFTLYYDLDAKMGDDYAPGGVVTH